MFLSAIKMIQKNYLPTGTGTGCHQNPVYRLNSSCVTYDGTPALRGSSAIFTLPEK